MQKFESKNTKVMKNLRFERIRQTVVISGASRMRPSSRVCVNSSQIPSICWMFKLEKRLI